MIVQWNTQSYAMFNSKKKYSTMRRKEKKSKPLAVVGWGQMNKQEESYGDFKGKQIDECNNNKLFKKKKKVKILRDMEGRNGIGWSRYWISNFEWWTTICCHLIIIILFVFFHSV